MPEPDYSVELRHRLAAEPKALIAAYLYGSRARGDAGPASDVDIALLFRSTPESGLDSPATRMQDVLERELGPPVDVLVLNGAPPDLVRRVIRDGVLLLDRDPAARLRFEVQVWKECFDLQPVLDLYRRKGRSVG